MPKKGLFRSICLGESLDYSEGSFYEGIEISDCTVIDSASGIEVSNVKNCLIEKCKVINVKGHSIFFTNDADSVTINNCHLFKNGEMRDEGWYCSGNIFLDCTGNIKLSNIFIKNCEIYSNIGSGIQIVGEDNSELSNIKIYYNEIFDNTDQGILLHCVQNIDIANNKIRDNSLYGIYGFNLGEDVKITNNRIINNGQKNYSFSSGIILINIKEDVKIEDNTINFNMNHGIYLLRSEKNGIKNNNISENNIGLKLESSPGNTLTYNTISKNDIGIVLSDCYYDKNKLITNNDFIDNGEDIKKQAKNFRFLVSRFLSLFDFKKIVLYLDILFENMLNRS